MKNQYVVGIDVGKNTNMAAMRDLKNEKVKFEFENNREGFAELIQNTYAQNPIFYLEATGFYHLPLAFYLRDNGYKVKVGNPLLTKKMAKASIRKTKTDSIDSSHLARLAQDGAGYFFEESRLICQLKMLCRHRHFLKKEIVRLKRHGQSVEFREVIFEKERANFIPDVLRDNDALISVLEEKVASVEERILALGADIPEIGYLDSLPGVSRLLACQLFSELGDITRFQTPRALVAFAGIDSSVAQSGISLHWQGKMSKRGSPYLRYYLFHASKAAIRCDVELKAYYLKKKSEGKHFYVSMAAVSRKLLLRINRVLRDKREYVYPQHSENL